MDIKDLSDYVICPYQACCVIEAGYFELQCCYSTFAGQERNNCRLWWHLWTCWWCEWFLNQTVVAKQLSTWLAWQWSCFPSLIRPDERRPPWALFRDSLVFADNVQLSLREPSDITLQAKTGADGQHGKLQLRLVSYLIGSQTQRIVSCFLAYYNSAQTKTTEFVTSALLCFICHKLSRSKILLKGTLRDELWRNETNVVWPKVRVKTIPTLCTFSGTGFVIVWFLVGKCFLRPSFSRS